MEIVTRDWHVTRAVHHEHLMGQSRQELSGQSRQELSLLRHPSYPFLAEISADPTTLFEELSSAAEDYINRIKDLDPSLELERALGFLKQRAPQGFGWLPITWDGPSVLMDPRGSFVVRRSRSGSELDRTIVLMAGNRSLKGDHIENVENIAVGLRVVMHADPPTQANAVPIRITGLSMCELGRMVNPEQGAQQRFEFFSALVQQIVEQSLGVQKPNVAGFEVVNAKWLRFVGVASRPSPVKNMPTGVLWNVELSLTNDQNDAEFVSVREQAQYTHAVAPEVLPTKLFHRDPASSGFACDIVERLPTHDTIDRYRDESRCLPERLEDTEGRFRVLQSSIADPQNDPREVQSIDRLNLPLRSDHLSAAQAFMRAREFFDLLSVFDFPADAYFKFAQLPLLMRHRAAFDSHPDGNAVMAQVRVVVDSPAPTRDHFERSTQPRLEVAFGSAALRCREVHPDDHGRPSAQPMGLAADRRWAWHEFGHVLSYAATGALEYEFAHSVGDALAAVLSDPTSYLAGDPLYDGETYPWVPAGRRHDRDAAAGWCWCGQRNGQRHAKLTFPPLLYKGYVEEQMLSSSVFRFYRAIGGHPSNETAMRERAANAAAYLLVRSASLLGPGSLVPARSADALVSAMVDADIGTRQPDRLFLGGCLHKVVRWAFERQGLFATAVPDENAEGPGLPPEVDLWVMDRRPNADKGGYEAVTLQWPGAQPEPDWFADPQQGAWEDESGNIHVIVRSRGAEPTTDVAVRAWKAPAGSDTLRWECLGEHHLATVPSGGAVPAFIAAGSSGAAHYLLVEVSAGEDRSNLDAETRLPCATGTPPVQPEAVRDLVANDNNLALRLIS